jgi:carbonic anhydrase/acetyltransferase-like protein (isoleucine patch superfamily)
MPTLSFDGLTPRIGERVFLAPNATVIGAVTLAPEVSVMFGAVLRADRDTITVGEGSNLQDNVVVHGDPGFPAVIGEGVSVGHGAIVHGATVEDDCLIGMGATLLNGVIVGAGSLIAAGSVVLEGTVIPPGSLVAGVPGKVRRNITPEELAGIRVNAQTYRDLGATYLASA